MEFSIPTNHKKYHFNLVFFGACLLFILAFGVYYYSAFRTNPGYADSDELITIGYLLGVGHPSGYPIHIILTKLFTLLPIAGTVAFKANLLAAFFHALTLVLLYLVCLKLIAQISSEKWSAKQNEVLQIVTAFLGSFLLGFSALFWLYSGINEVFPINNFLGLLVFYLALLWEEAVRKEKNKVNAKEKRLFLATCFIAGFGLANIQVFILLLPALCIFLFYTLINTKKIQFYFPVNFLLLIVFPVLGFVLPTLLLFPLNARQADVSWYFEQNLHGLVKLITRQDFAGFIPEKNITINNAYMLNKIDINAHLQAIPNYLIHLNEHFSYLGLILFVLTLVWLFFMQRKIFYLLTPFFFFPGFLFAVYMKVKPEDSQNLVNRAYIGVSQRQYLLGEVFFAIFLILALWILLQLLIRYFKFKYKQILIFAVILFLSLDVWFFLDNKQMGINRDNRMAWDYARQVLDDAEDNSLIVCMADFSCFSLFYMQEVEHYRPQVKVLTRNQLLQKHYLNKNPGQYLAFNYRGNPFFTADMISYSLLNHKVYLTDPSIYYSKYMGFEANPFFLIPKHYLYEITKKVPEKVESYDYNFTQKLIQQTKSKKDYWARSLNDYFANFHNVMGIIYGHLGLKKEASQNFGLSAQLTPDNQISQNLKMKLNFYNGNPYYSFGSVSSSSAELLKISQQQFQDGEVLKAYDSNLKALFMDPLNTEARMNLISLYKVGRYYNQAREEIFNVLKYDPSNQEAKKALEDLPKE
ncbi:DUF2723 domain-containing protein [Candidatus Beckwithbacteria bacterium]|nr:DUF2723 domain-containing protein [Candidatus Beckwithbacteria bacterium]